MIYEIVPSIDKNLWLKSFDIMIQLKYPNVLSQQMKGRVTKTLRTSKIYSPMFLTSLDLNLDMDIISGSKGGDNEQLIQFLEF